MRKSMTGKKRSAWWVVFTGFLLMALAYTPNINLAGLYVNPLAQAFGVPTTAVTTSITVFILCSMLGSVVAGKILSRYPVRNVMCILLVVSAACFGMNVMLNSLPAIYVFAAVRGFCGSALTIVPISVMINQWFSRSQQGKAMGIAIVGSGIGTIILSPLLSYLMERAGWQAGYLASAAMLLILIPLVWVTFVPSNADANGAEKKENIRDHGVSAADAIKLPVFWLLAISVIAMAGATQAWGSNGASFLADLGMDAVKAGGLMSASAVGLTAGKLLLGGACDRFGTRRGTGLGAAALIVSYILFIISYQAGILALPGALLVGFGQAVVNVVIPLFTAELFGNRDYAVLVSYMQVASALGGSLIPLVVSMLYDWNGSYVPAWSMNIVLSVLFTWAMYMAYGKAVRT